MFLIKTKVALVPLQGVIYCVALAMPNEGLATPSCNPNVLLLLLSTPFLIFHWFNLPLLDRLPLSHGYLVI